MSDAKYKSFRATGEQISQEKIAERAGCSSADWVIEAYGYENTNMYGGDGYTYIRASKKNAS